MSKSSRSQSWYRVAGLRPRLRTHARMHRQRFRGQTWYVLQDQQNGRYHRLSPAAHYFACMMDGRRTVGEIRQLIGARYGEHQPTEDELIRLLAQLHAADLLLGEIPPDMEEISERAQRHARYNLMQHLRNPLALRLPLLDPDRFLVATLSLARVLFSTSGLLVWLALVAAGIVVAAMNWSVLTHNITDQVLTAGNIVLLLAIYPVIKTLHELGHAYATRRWGGEVHEMGVMLLALMPVPYVDASASSAFPRKWRRVVVGAAGIMVEAALAAVAVILWVSVESGIVRAIAFNVALICGVSTILFNGNPLLRFDGYYVLSDLLEIPNLGTRANQYVGYLVQRCAFRIDDAHSPVTAPGEQLWLLGFAVASFLYRLSVMLGVALFIGTKLFFIGVGLALWTVASSLMFPLVKGLCYVARSPQLRYRRRRALAITAAAAGSLLVLLLVVPLPYATLAQGVVVVPDQSAARVLTDGHVVEVLAPNDTNVAAGAPLLTLEDPILAGQTAVLAIQAETYRLRLGAVLTSDLVQANILREQIRHVDSALELNRKRMSQLTLVAGKAGRVMLPGAADLPGRYVKKGDLLGYVVEASDLVVRVVVPQNDVDLVRRRTTKVEVRFVDRNDQIFPAIIVREVPSAVAELPSLALSTRGGGDIALDPSKPDAPKALESQFQFDLHVPEEVAARVIGGRVYVRFDHGTEPIAWRVVRSVRQLFLRQFSV
ncbi:PqqD family peptide modification chaperone [Bradyrhizobium sp. CNPSo 4010]|uniref:PqqD family peptide modification chaperone n=1 Tax=Bradyrhizobium agreste TaxID=2751811 RepID=A0ABS0PZG9_9BRAD|nr:PqqD family protein [Bradyrhizobium agreste]MBH5402615.1 PqqD family peptide modification chaperone [Bradyrhizobium agreste]